MKSEKTNINNALNLPVHDQLDDSEISYQLFHCVKCGIHPLAYSITIVKGCEDQALIKFMNVLPDDIQVSAVYGEILTDTEVIETLFCGKC